MKDKVIKQLKRYELDSFFESFDDMKKWIDSLNEVEKNSIINLDIDNKEIRFSLQFLLDRELLSIEDFPSKIKAITTLKNTENGGCDHLLDNLFNKEFFKSKNFYKDIEMASKMKTARYCLWILGDSIFINSPFHEEDLKLLVESHDVKKELRDNDLSRTVWDNLATIAKNEDSINSPYHRQDMQLIASVDSSRLQSLASYPKHSIGYLAQNSISLNDNRHLVNMKKLVENPEIDFLLYPVMTDENFIESNLYTQLIDEMIEHKNDKFYEILLCIYAIGLDKVSHCITLNLRPGSKDFRDIYWDIKMHKDLDALLENVSERLNVIETTSNDINFKEIETKEKQNVKSRLRRFLRF